MRTIPILVILLASCGFKKVESRPDNDMIQSQASIFDFQLQTISGEEVDLTDYKGKKLLIVNTASECGYTPQYEDLQALHEMHGDKVTILGFPSNDFGGQEPGTNEEIASFCKKNYGVSFQMFEKINVKGKEKHPLYQWLSSKEMNGWNDQEPNWNFCKYLVNEEGELLKFYASAVNPMSSEILDDIL